MNFYELCRSLRDKYQTEPNKEIELQIVSQLFLAVFITNDELPSVITFELDVKSLLKNGWTRPNKDLWQDSIASWPIKARVLFWMKETLSDKIMQVLDEFGIEYWWSHYFCQKSAWTYSIEIGISSRYKSTINK